MKILKRIVEGNTIVGYQVEDGDFILPICKRGLFTELYIEPLIAAGYKYFGYDADLIEDADGNPISSYEAMDFSEVDDVEWFSSVNIADSSALTDAEAAKYYTFREESAISFRTEESYEINTREELVQYLTGLNRSLFTASFSTDNRPLNSFVNPEALFTIDELIEDADVKQYFAIIMRRHKMRNWAAYEYLINYLYDKGVLTTKTPTTAEFLSAYYAWGPEGLKDKCTSFDVKMNVDGVFSFIKDPLSNSDPMTHVSANRVAKVTVIDGNENVHFLKTHENMSNITDIKEFGRSRIIVNSNDMLLSIRRMQNTGHKYSAVGGTLYSDVSDRVYFNVIAGNGYTYTYKVAHNKLKIGLAYTNTNQEIFGITDNFGFASVTPYVTIPLDVVHNATDYFMWNMSILKAAQLIDRKSKKAPAQSTTEFLLKDGVNPIATVDMMANSISKNPQYLSNRKYNLETKGSDLTDALELYLRDIPDYILKAYNLTEDDLEDGINTFLDIADVDDLCDRRELMMSLQIGPNDPGFDPTYNDYSTKIGKKNADMNQLRSILAGGESMIDAVDYYTKIKFVSDCIRGKLSVNNFGDGILNDMGASYMVAAECILSVVYAEFGNNPDRQTAIDFIVNIENSDLIDINKIFRKRDMALKGYLADYGKYRETRANANAWVWAYCTKVFREISNAPIEQQRPYLMELVVVSNNKNDMPTRTLMAECVKQAIEAYGFDDTKFDEEGDYAEVSEKSVALQSADYVAAKLFFYVLAGGVKTEPVNGNYIIPINLQDDKNIEVSLPVGVVDFIKRFDKESHKRYITVYDFCKYEYNPNTKYGTFNICLVNADIDPWHVKPKKGYSIKSYSLLSNYYEQSTLDNANGEGYYLQNYNQGTIAVTPLKTIYRSKFIPESPVEETLMYEDICKAAQSSDALAEFLYMDQYEYIFAYVKRWAVARKTANAMGKKLISIPLKQDIVYAPFAHSFCDEIPPQEPVYTDDIYFDDKQAQNTAENRIISWKMFDEANLSLQMSQVSIKEFQIRDINLDDIPTIQDIISGEYVSTIPVVVSGNYINVKDDSLIKVAVTRMTPNDIAQFTEAGIMRQISDNKYFIRAINGDYIVEV